VSIELAGARISSRAAWRPLALAVALLAGALWRTSAANRRQMIAAIGTALDRRASAAAALLAVTIAAVSAIFGSHVAGGADSSGYLSQSRLWAAGRITMAAPVIADRPWPERGRLVSPLGYRPTGVADELGPTYAPGLPWLMAAAAVVAGDAGRYVWTPLLAGLLVWGTFRLAAGAAPPSAALAAALLVAGSPPVLFEATQTMSDLPVAAVWTWVLVWGRRPGWRATWGAGLVAAVALLVRPNLVVAAGGIWLALLAIDTGPIGDRLKRAVMRALPLAAAALAIAAINARLWGSPFVSGYGPAAEIFGRDNVIPNLRDVWRWIGETRAWWIAAGLVAIGAFAIRSDGRRWWPPLALVVGVLASYLPYARFAEWWYLRFYLPAWPVLAAACVAGVWTVTARRAPDLTRLGLVAAAAGAALVGAADAERAGVFELWRGDQRYKDVGRYVAAHARPDAVVFAVQHSGSLAYYSGRTVARFDEVASGDLDRLCDDLAASGRDVWLVADDWEEPQIRARFAGQVRGRLDWAPIAEARVGTARVRVYDVATTTRATGPALIAVARGGVWPWARDRGTPAQ
jgi:hypothetical protein